MKNLTVLTLLLLIIGNTSAVDTESYQFIDHLLSISGPGAPEIYEDAVIFTQPSSYRRVGIAFAHEGYAQIYWFKKLFISDEEPVASRRNAESGLPPATRVVHRDSGMLFHVYTFPEELGELRYRLIIDGLWTTDPSNPRTGIDQRTGLSQSLISLPAVRRESAVFDSSGQPGGLSFSFTAPPGEHITVAGNFNNWDPFMYTLKETSAGVYTLTLPLPPGTYHYVFFHRGQRLLDPRNPFKAYTREGQAASEALVR
ncbi:MAG: glycogen-binding domain-containing protein [Spirochaetaceae bacterium]|nr:glycogen-binding domain-containing protein [Spirochaetaceae bacterium]